jgi:hypothetical protein
MKSVPNWISYCILNYHRRTCQPPSSLALEPLPVRARSGRLEPFPVFLRRRYKTGSPPSAIFFLFSPPLHGAPAAAIRTPHLPILLPLLLDPPVPPSATRADAASGRHRSHRSFSASSSTQRSSEPPTPHPYPVRFTRFTDAHAAAPETPSRWNHRWWPRLGRHTARGDCVGARRHAPRARTGRAIFRCGLGQHREAAGRIQPSDRVLFFLLYLAFV